MGRSLLIPTVSCKPRGIRPSFRYIRRVRCSSDASRLRPLLALGLGLALTACSGAGGARRGPAAPGWFNQPPKSARTLFFAGAASGAADEQTARDLAVQKAMSELTVFCGAQITSDFSSSEQEVNGKLTQSVSLTVDIAGDEMTIREATVREAETGAASDGTWDAYVLVAWPKARYQEVLAMQRQRAERALAVFLKAKSAADALQLADAATHLSEAKQILGPMKAQVPLDHPDYGNSALLFDAITALRGELKAKDAERRKVFHVSVVCSDKGAEAPCADHRIGAMKQRVAGTGFKVSATAVAPKVAREILASSSPSQDKALRSAGFVLAVHYRAKLTAEEDGFTFVHCGARGVVYDTDANRIVEAHEVKPVKGGHVHFEGAKEKSCAKAEKKLQSWIDSTLPRFAQ